MTHHLRYARGLTTTATLSTGSAGYLATTNTPLWSLPVGYVAGFLAWCAQREYVCHRALLVEHERARRAARVGEAGEVVGPCCEFWRHSGGAVHGPGCPRPPDPTVEFNSSCCMAWFVSRGDEHDATCPSRSPRSSAA